MLPLAPPTLPKPIKRIQASEKDLRILKETQAVGRPRCAEQPGHYRDKVVLKPWGHEFLVYENAHVAVWFLHIRKDHSTSLHCHPGKCTALSVLWGQALCNTFQQRHFLSPGDAVNLGAQVFHSTKALSLDGVFLIETETPNNKSDLVRLKDHYGRQADGYEGISKMEVSHLEVFRHFSFAAGVQPFEVVGDPFIQAERYSICFEGYQGTESFAKRFSPDPGALYTTCLGELLDAESRPVAAIGQVERGGLLRQIRGLQVQGPVLLLKIQIFD